MDMRWCQWQKRLRNCRGFSSEPLMQAELLWEEAEELELTQLRVEVSLHRLLRQP